MDVTSYLLGKQAGGGSKPPVLQDKEVTITENGTTNVTPDEGYDGLSEVKVTTDVAGSGISDYFYEIIKDGNTYVPGIIKTLKKVPSPLIAEGTSLAFAFKYFEGSEIPTINGTNSITDMNSMFNYCTGLKNLDLSYFNTSNVTNMSGMFSGCSKLESINLANFNTRNVTNMNYMFSGCSKLESLNISNFDTSKVTSMTGMFMGLSACKTIQCNLDLSVCTNIVNMFINCGQLENIGTFSNIGKGFLTTASANYNQYKLDVSQCSRLTHDSLMNIINGLYDIASKGVQPQQLVLGATNLAKLSQAEIDIATNKGWAVS